MRSRWSNWKKRSATAASRQLPRRLSMEMMTGSAYGFRNFENYSLRVSAHCGRDGIINRV
ncbi:hypothetical protein NOR51B_2597 [Luminiphilus syltensis NOR5-1B]|uniref:Uncharacterized protein n=1 Tax=Luminiphilus syltensis NOR5-1B TaxID=565045 RepID=B8KXT6_9GAMM|nr:hypothetical protein NOR51B_2597 [Luminiphilus syltensis NOR5-1B]